MNNDEQDLARRAVRDAVFRAGRMRLAGRTSAADELLASELFATQGRLGAAGAPDAAALVRLWGEQDESAFALAQLISELVGDRIQSSVTPHQILSVDQPMSPPLPPALAPRAAAEPPSLVDLLDGMLTEERRAKRRPA